MSSAVETSLIIPISKRFLDFARNDRMEEATIQAHGDRAPWLQRQSLSLNLRIRLARRSTATSASVPSASRMAVAP